MFIDFLSVSLLVSAIMVIVCGNQVHSLFFLVSVFLQMAAILLVRYNIDFVSFLIIIVYVGAIAILFLFVVMMLDVNAVRQGSSSSFFGLFLSSIGLLVLVINTNLFYFIDSVGLFAAISKTSNILYERSWLLDVRWEDLVMKPSDLFAISTVIYNSYYESFLASSFVLLLAMIGAINLTLKQKPYVRRQSVASQNTRNFSKTVVR